jgi:Ca2+-binding EF-hand superfamily protein
MKNRLLRCAFVCLLCYPAAGVTARASEPSTDPTDLQDIYLLHPRRLIMVRLHIRLHGQGYQASWSDYLWDQFQELDADGDGMLDNDEFLLGDWNFIATRRTKEGAMRNEIATFLDLDTDPQDGGVSFTEIVKHLAQSCFAVTRNAPQQQQGAGDPLFDLLDVDHNRQLDTPEITAGLARLYRYDRDEDEVFSLFELRSDGNPFLNNIAVAGAGGGGRQPNNEMLLAPVPGQALDALAQLLIARYDRAPAGSSQGDKMLAREELHVPPEQFVEADSDGDAQIDAAELEVWLDTRLPDIELAVSLDRDAAQDQRLQVIGSPEDKQLAVVPAKDGTVAVRGKSFELELQGIVAPDNSRREKQGTQLFKRADQDQNDYLDRQELRRINPNVDFTRIDKDRDGKIFIAEYLAFTKRRNELAGRRVDVALSDRGSTLFEILDANRDNQLATRELRALESMVVIWDADSDGKIAPDDVPRRYQCSIAPGGVAGAGNNGTFIAISAGEANGRGGQQPTGIGPEWFQRMDRNRDGDLSRREFLGRRAAFERLDADHDGLLDAKEAEAVDAK